MGPAGLGPGPRRATAGEPGPSASGSTVAVATGAGRRSAVTTTASRATTRPSVDKAVSVSGKRIPDASNSPDASAARPTAR